MSLGQFDKFRVDGEASTRIVKQQPVDAPVLAFDQSLANCGWVLLAAKPSLVAWGTIKTEPAGGMIGNIERGTELAAQVRQVFAAYGYEIASVVLETPPILGISRRGESSLLAAQVIHTEATRGGYSVSFVGAQRVKKRLTGNARASKREVKQAVAGWGLSPAKLNEHVSDAVGLGLVAMGLV